jgi:hypothetical protein
MASTVIDNDKLMTWYHAVFWAVLVLEEQIKQAEDHGLNASLHKKRLAELQELLEFLDAAWQAWLGKIATTPEEIK